MRPTLLESKKFKLALRRLGVSKPLLLGHLELVWESAHSCGEPVFSCAEALEATAEWDGEAGRFSEVLSEPGSNFFDRVDGGGFVVHDYWDHAPEYVRDRRRKELQRRETGKKLGGGGRGGAGLSDKSPDISGKCSDRAGKCAEKSDTPTPTPTPAPTPEELNRPIPIGGLASSMMGGIVRAQAESLARLAGQGAEWVPWWEHVLMTAAEGPALSAIDEAARYVEDCGNPVTRKRKDLGALKDPAAFLVKRSTAALREQGTRWPRFPVAVSH